MDITELIDKLDTNCAIYTNICVECQSNTKTYDCGKCRRLFCVRCLSDEDIVSVCLRCATFSG